MPKVVVAGATLQCTCGTAPVKLVVTSQTHSTTEGKLTATVMDFQPLVNIPPFGTCNVLTAAALGVPTPCAMVPLGPWKPGSTSPCQVGPFPVLLETDLLGCAIPGVIRVVEPGQVTATDG